MKYPLKTNDQDPVEKADKFQLARWMRFLPSPSNRTEEGILNRIEARFKSMGGWEPGLSQVIGWKPPKGSPL
jgi:hypothetical protein